MSKNKDLGNPEVRNSVFRYLNEMQISADAIINDVKTESDLDHIKRNNYIAIPQYEGTPIWFCWFRQGECYYAVTFPKNSKSRKYKASIYPIDMMFSKSFYLGTIMDGTHYRDRGIDYFIVNDVYQLAGANQLAMTRTDRIDKALDYLKIHSTVTNQNYQMYVCRYYPLNKFSLSLLFSKIRNEDRIRQVMFYPNIYGYKMYQYTLNDSDKVEHIVKQGVFDLVKGTRPDVYHICYVDSSDKIGIAYIPNTTVTKMCRAWFQKKKKVRVLCQMDPIKQKYVPVELSA